MLNNSGNFEFVTATRNVPAAGGPLTFRGTGAGNGLLNTYTSAAYSAGAQGQRTYQIIRVPQYTSVALSSNITAMAWDGTNGGVLAIDATSQVTLGGTVALDGLGFRAGGGRILGGGTGANTDYVTLSTINTNGPKGEGIAGTPAYVLSGPVTALSQTALYTGSEGLPGGSQARGAPGNAGGGGTDGDTVNTITTAVEAAAEMAAPVVTVAMDGTQPRFQAARAARPFLRPLVRLSSAAVVARAVPTTALTTTRPMAPTATIAARIAPASTAVELPAAGLSSFTLVLSRAPGSSLRMETPLSIRTMTEEVAAAPEVPSASSLTAARLLA